MNEIKLNLNVKIKNVFKTWKPGWGTNFKLSLVMNTPWHHLQEHSEGKSDWIVREG